MARASRNHRRWFWVDCLKAIGILWIFLTHVAESLFGSSIIGHPTNEWTTLQNRINWLRPLPIDSAWSLTANFLRTIGWGGNLAVAFFLLASGFGLTWSALRGGGELNALRFLNRRASRIFPLWWTAHFVLLAPAAMVGFQISLADPQFYLSLLGIRITASQFFYGIPAWWFIPVMLQLYLVFPFAFCAVHSNWRRPLLALMVACTILRGVGLFYFDDYLHAWSCGAIFISRFPEFALGMWVAFECWHHPEQVENRMLRWWMMPAGLLGIIVAYAISVSVLGCVFAHSLAAISGFVLAYQATLVDGKSLVVSRIVKPAIEWLSSHTLSIFLAHHPIVWILLRNRDGKYFNAVDFGLVWFALALSLLGATVLERMSTFLWQQIVRSVQRRSLMGVAFRVAIVLCLWMVIALPTELAIRKYNPQDVPDFGWAERPSLEPHPQLGFKLRPSSRTRLRWESYDYVVVSNSHGFPGPEFDLENRSDAIRILTLGDAFTSAEGVDTEFAWPRILEKTLANHKISKSRDVEVINMGITGYGPIQYEWLATEYIPTIKPDLVVIGFFTNDFIDVFATAKEFERMIGFGRPNRESLLGYLTARHTFRVLRGLAEQAFEKITRRPSPHTRFFCQCDVFERARYPIMLDAQQLIKARFAKIKSVAEQCEARVILAMIPAPLQVVDGDQLDYVRPFFQLDNTNQFDYEQPQRLAREIASGMNFGWLDLREALKSASKRSPFQARNLHFTRVGHEVSARALLPVVTDHILANQSHAPVIVEH